MSMIIFDHVTKVYGAGEAALNDVTFEVNNGDFVVLKGHSGAGKTTIAKLLMKEILPTSGVIHFQGVNLDEVRKSKVHLHRRQIGVVYQDYKLLPELNVFENIALALRIAGKEKAEIESRIADLLQLVQLSEKIHFFPSQLSGGEAQRVSIARALANAPEILFADEPTGNLDQDTTRHIIQVLKKINQLGTTIIMSTHENIDFKGHPHREFVLLKGSLQPEQSLASDETSENVPKEQAVQEETPEIIVESPKKESKKKTVKEKKVTDEKVEQKEEIIT